MTKQVMQIWAFAVGLIVQFPLCAKDAVVPGGSLPVLHEVDVVVVGGSSGGVAAAVEAAKKGAKVFLAAPRPYLGEDICSTYRLWLEPGEKPATELARQIFQPSPAAPVVATGVRFTYKADKPSAPQHRDTRTESLLGDGKWQSASSQSVQYDGSVTLLVDLGQVRRITKVSCMAYQRNDDFEVQQVDVSASIDNQKWIELPALKNDKVGQGAFEGGAMVLTAAVPKTEARYLKLAVQKTPGAKRVLLGEIVVEDDSPTEARPPAADAPQPVTPMQVKRTLDQALLQAGVPFLYGSFPAEILRDANGKPAGVVIANRSGRQAVVAKVIIDATERAAVARMAGAKFNAYPPETQYFTRAVVGGQPQEGQNISLQNRTKPVTLATRTGERLPLYEYKVQMAMKDGSYGAFAEAEQLARDWTWTDSAVDGSECLFQVAPDGIMNPQQEVTAWPGASKLPLESLQPKDADGIYVLGACAGVSREAAAQLVRPVNMLEVGERLGSYVGSVAREQAAPKDVKLAGKAVSEAAKGEVRAVSGQTSIRQAGARALTAEAHGLPVLGEYDVVVVGGGTGGAPAGIGAAREGAKVLLLEYLHGLGGVGTIGLISSYYHGNRVGFTSEVDEGIAAMTGPNTRTQSGWNPETKIEWYRRELRKAGVEIWYGAMGTGALVENGWVRGVFVSTPHGPGVVLARIVIDSTGNADIAAAAGATCRYTDDTDVAVQGTGLPPKELGSRYTNTDFTFVDDTDVFDLWRVLVTARQKYKGAYDLGQLIDTRERRQIVGDFTLSPMDMMLRRTHEDTIVIAQSNFDTHGFIVHPMFMLRSPDRAGIAVRVPYRCLLPKGLEGIMVTGLGISAHRDAVPVIRMQADVQNQGYAAGVAAAMLSKQSLATRQLDIKALQRHLVKKGNLPESVLTEKDSFPLPKEKVVEAVGLVANEYEKLEVCLSHFEVAQPLLREAYAKAQEPKARLIYGHVLGMMGDATGTDALLSGVAAGEWDGGWRYTGMGQFGPCMSRLDSLIIALGRTGDKRGLGPIVKKVGELRVESEFSHFRAVAMALEALGDRAAAKPLAELLQKPGMGGHAVTNINAALQSNPANPTDTTIRNKALSELILARALYRCGDYQGLGEKTLRAYAQDLHGHYARHAQAILKAKVASTRG